MPAADAAALLRRNATDPDRRDRPALHFGDRTWTHAEYVAECQRFANLFLARTPSGSTRGTHVGVLLDNTPDYLFALGGAALAGAAVVGLNHTRRDEHLLRDIDAHALRPRDHRAPPRRRCSRRSPDDLPPSCSSRIATPTTTIPRSSLGADLDDALAGVERRRPGPRARSRHALGADLHVGHVRRARRR